MLMSLVSIKLCLVSCLLHPKSFNYWAFSCKLLSKSLSKINEGNYPVDDEKMKTKIPQEIAILNEQFWWILQLAVSLLKWKKKKRDIKTLDDMYEFWILFYFLLQYFN